MSLDNDAYKTDKMPGPAGWRRVKPCDFGIDAHRSTEWQSVALRQPAVDAERAANSEWLNSRNEAWL
jgi:hypothetical protein